MKMVQYFGVTIREKTDGLKLTRDNYIKVNNKSSFIKGKTYDENFIKRHTENYLYNFDLNMKYFRSLSKIEFNEELAYFLSETEFNEVDDLSLLSNVTGYYLMVLDKYNQVYIGTSSTIKSRIQSHWSKQKEFDRLIFGSKNDSILSIDSFRAYDTTRIFVYAAEETMSYEDNFINLFNNKFILNRTSGGSITGLMEAVVNAKTRIFK